MEYLDSLSDEELKKESKNESRNDALSSIIKVGSKPPEIVFRNEKKGKKGCKQPISKFV